jgi:hypothetical protein
VHGGYRIAEETGEEEQESVCALFGGGVPVSSDRGSVLDTNQEILGVGGGVIREIPSLICSPKCRDPEQRILGVVQKQEVKPCPLRILIRHADLFFFSILLFFYLAYFYLIWCWF